MAQLNVKMPEEQLARLRRYADRRRTPVAWLIKDYVDYLLSGGDPVVPRSLAGGELAAIAEQGGAFDWLRDEPDLYTREDGEPV